MDTKRNLTNYWLSYISESMARYIFLQILQALKSLKLLNYVHKELRPESIILTRSFVVNIGNFINTEKIRPENNSVKFNYLTNKCYHVAPEYYRNKGLLRTYESYKYDLFSAGVILYFIFKVDFPTNQKTSYENRYEDYVNDLNYSVKKFNELSVSQDLKNLIKGNIIN